MKVIDNGNMVQLNYPVIIEYHAIQKDYNTGETGIIDLDQLQAGKSIKIIDRKKVDNFQTYTIAEDTDE